MIGLHYVCLYVCAYICICMCTHTYIYTYIFCRLCTSLLFSGEPNTQTCRELGLNQPTIHKNVILKNRRQKNSRPLKLQPFIPTFIKYVLYTKNYIWFWQSLSSYINLTICLFQFFSGGNWDTKKLNSFLRLNKSWSYHLNPVQLDLRPSMLSSNICL